MPDASDIQWFKQQFHGTIEAGVANTPFDLDMLTAIACQETGEVWPILRKKNLTTQQILALCVGDTIDARPNGKGRQAFPKTRADLVAKPNGQTMFDIARKALVDMAQYIPSYQAAAANPNKLCHGFGLFQYDLQFFLKEPDYFLQRRYEQLGETLQKCLIELVDAMKRMGWAPKQSLTDYEMACVTIAYNTGGFNPKKGLKQGYFDGQKYYGEQTFDFIRLSRTISLPGGSPQLVQPPPGNALVAPPTPVEATGAFYKVNTLAGTLRLRTEPKISAPPTANVVGDLPDGQIVRSVTGNAVKGFLEVETSLAGAHLRGFASANYLEAAPAATEVPVTTPAASLPTTGIVAVYMPRKPGTITKRTDVAGPHSLNEPNQPARNGTTPDELRAELAAIIDWLAVDKPAYKRYQPKNKATFCNIYAHDYCFLAGVYLPRVWWTPKAIEDLAQGKAVEPLYGNTIDEQRANDLFRWLRDFGDRFGWRQTGTLTKLQQEVNQGALGLIVARRKQDGLSGHIVAVVPETDAQRARRDAAGDVVAPLQSQAGSVNFRYGTGRPAWWKGDQFAESGFWLHS
jgi:hypothetical protein